MSAPDIPRLFEAHSLFEKTAVFDRGSFLKKGGTIDTNIYFIEEGAAYVFILDGAEERIVRLAYKSNIVVALDSFLTGVPSDFYIQAIKKTTVKIVRQADFQQFISRDAANQALWTGILEDLVLQQVEREKDLLIQSPLQRYQRVLKRSPQLFQQIPNKYIASYLRMSAETLSRLKKP
ncbi:Crp/Fnr family transcriptional regulator [Niabella insulamsoli]|uniref:Crp/Fnr family transcriptional regulator n=1 Tax=Niabella insulamsoli TaxID=3144874 RepID=UPI0031FCECED